MKSSMSLKRLSVTWQCILICLESLGRHLFLGVFGLQGCLHYCLLLKQQKIVAHKIFLWSFILVFCFHSPVSSDPRKDSHDYIGPLWKLKMVLPTKFLIHSCRIISYKVTYPYAPRIHMWVAKGLDLTLVYLTY